MASDPAVSAYNGKISVEGGNYNGSEGGMAQAVFSAPLKHAYGFQGEAAIGHFLGADYHGVGGHLFWRDPKRALVGLTLSHQSLDPISLNRVGVEGEMYVNAFTFGARAGHQYGQVQKGQYEGVSARFYAQPNVVFRLGLDHSPGINSARLGAEWMPGLHDAPGLSVFFEAQRASFNYDSAVVGVRYYFGGGKHTLRQRHRNDDPDSVLQDSLVDLYRRASQAEPPACGRNDKCPLPVEPI